MIVLVFFHYNLHPGAKSSSQNQKLTLTTHLFSVFFTQLGWINLVVCCHTCKYSEFLQRCGASLLWLTDRLFMCTNSWPNISWDQLYLFFLDKQGGLWKRIFTCLMNSSKQQMMRKQATTVMFVWTIISCVSVFVSRLQNQPTRSVLPHSSQPLCFIFVSSHFLISELAFIKHR